MGSEDGVSEAQLLAVTGDLGRAASVLDDRTLAALEYADAMTLDDVDDAAFAAARAHFDDDELVELTAAIAWENASARFNRALRVESQHLWHRRQPVREGGGPHTAPVTGHTGTHDKLRPRRGPTL